MRNLQNREATWSVSLSLWRGVGVRLLLPFSFFLISCNPSKPASTYPVKVDTVTLVKDTIIYIPTFDYEMKDSMVAEMNHLRDSLFVERYKVERVRYYLKICQRKPSQTKFLLSWINRAIN